MQTSVTPESLISLTDQQGVGSAASPEVDTPQPHVEHTVEKRSKTDFVCDLALHEGSEPIRSTTPIRPHEIVDNYGPYGRHLVQDVNPADIILVCRLNMHEATIPELSAPHEEEELPELLDFSIDIEQI